MSQLSRQLSRSNKRKRKGRKRRGLISTMYVCSETLLGGNGVVEAFAFVRLICDFALWHGITLRWRVSQIVVWLSQEISLGMDAPTHFWPLAFGCVKGVWKSNSFLLLTLRSSFWAVWETVKGKCPVWIFCRLCNNRFVKLSRLQGTEKMSGSRLFFLVECFDFFLFPVYCLKDSTNVTFLNNAFYFFMLASWVYKYAGEWGGKWDIEKEREREREVGTGCWLLFRMECCCCVKWQAKNEGSSLWEWLSRDLVWFGCAGSKRETQGRTRRRLLQFFTCLQQLRCITQLFVNRCTFLLSSFT